MKAERIPLDSLISGGSAVKTVRELAARISGGAVFIYPTETIYGVGGIVEPGVEKRVLDAKRKACKSPMILVASRIEAFDGLGLSLTDNARKLADTFWPGNLTLIVACAPGNRSVGIRVSGHAFLTAIGTYLDRPIYSTSANVSGEPYYGDPDSIYEIFSEAVDFMVDAGSLPPSAPSSVVDVSVDGEVRVIREGAVSSGDIMAAIESGGTL